MTWTYNWRRRWTHFGCRSSQPACGTFHKHFTRVTYGYSEKAYLEVVLAEFSTLSSAAFVQVQLHAIDKHAQILCWKLGPGFILLA